MSKLEGTIKVAIFDQFLDAFAALPSAQQKKVNKFVRMFRSNPTSRGINYEKIHDFDDQNLRTVRIDDAYRAIVLKPEKGDVYVLLWVDHHDEAMAWARHKRVEVHPETGSLQVLSLAATPAPSPVAEPPPPKAKGRTKGAKAAAADVPAPAAAAPKTPEPAPRPLLAAHAESDLLSLGVPPALLPAVRQVASLDELEAMQAQLPPEAFEAAYYLACGESLEEVRRALDPGPKREVDPTDFATALETDAARRSFVVVEDDDELAAMLEAPLERWRVFLHPTQRQLVERPWSGPVRVLGGAGTGKTVVAMHRAAWLAEKAFPKDDDRILFTTFTANLAADIAQNLASICPARALARIEVVHLDGWIGSLLRTHGYPYELEYWKEGEGRLWDRWQAALERRPGDLPETFFREEWDYVVQPSGCATLDGYIAAPRAGRGVRLTRAQRRAIWPVFEDYRNALESARLRESVDAMRDAAGLLERREVVLGYKAVVVDEAQDMSTVAFRLLRQAVPAGPNDMFLVGDGHQRIYRRQVVLGQAGVHIVGRSRRLRVNYRTTDELRRAAVALLEGVRVDDLDGGADTTAGYRSLVHGDPPQVVRCKTFDEEVAAIARFVNEGDLTRTCLAARTHQLVSQYAAALESRGVPVHRVARRKAEDRSAPGLRIATLHRVKGLEFDRVAIAGVNEGVVPLTAAVGRTDDAAVGEDAERQERALLYVGLTRARRGALISSFGAPSPWLATVASVPTTWDQGRM